MCWPQDPRIVEVSEVTDLVFSGQTYRIVDTVTKLLGVGLLAGALELGIVSAPGMALVLAGGILGVSTVFVSEDTQ